MKFSDTRLGIAVSRLALWISVIVALGVPGGYWIVEQSQLEYELTMLGELKSTRLAKYIYTHQTLWQYHRIRLAEIIEVQEADETEVLQRIFDVGRNLILESGEVPPFPVLYVRVPVRVGGAQVATV